MSYQGIYLSGCFLRITQRVPFRPRSRSGKDRTLKKKECGKGRGRTRRTGRRKEDEVEI
jgi:hypothetical protein